MIASSLNGTWELYRAEEGTPIPATVTRCLHIERIAVGRIEDPYSRDNETRLPWISETDVGGGVAGVTAGALADRYPSYGRVADARVGCGLRDYRGVS